MNNNQLTTQLIKDSKILHLSTQATSAILLNGSMKSKARYDLRSYIDFENDDSIEYATVSLPYAVITNSNYIVNQNNNKLVIFYNGNTYTYYFDYGNYTVNSFINALYSFLPSSVWSITNSSLNNKFTIGFKTFPFTLKSETTCDYILGFSGDTSSSSTKVGDYYTLTCPRSCNFLPIPRFVVHCDVINNGIILGQNSSVAASDILMTIPNTSKLNTQIVYENNETEFLLRNMNINNITITITDDNNREIDFNGLSSYFMIRVNIFRRNVVKPLKFKSLMEYISKIDEPIEEIFE